MRVIQKHCHEMDKNLKQPGPARGDGVNCRNSQPGLEKLIAKFSVRREGWEDAHYG